MNAANNGDLEAKIVVLGSQGVGKTSLVNRYVKNAFTPPERMTSTIGASFLTKRVIDIDSGTVVRQQIWDTAGQERFRSISKLYYRGANAALLCYDITSTSSFTEMGHWLLELRANLPEDTILHVVGTKADIVAEDPSKRKVPFERCIAYVAENLYPSAVSQNPHHTSSSYFPPNPSASSNTIASSAGNKSNPNLLGGRSGGPATESSNNNNHNGNGNGNNQNTNNNNNNPPLGSPNSNRSSMGFWGQDLGWDCCHEVSASSGEGVEEVFRVITRRLVEQRNSRVALEARLLEDFQGGLDDRRNLYREHGGAAGGGGAGGSAGEGYHHGGGPHNGSFRVGVGDKRRSWLGLGQFPGLAAEHTEEDDDDENPRRKRGPCCT